MNVTLRKANAIQVSINETLKGLEFTDTVSINEFQVVDVTFTNASAKFFDNVVRRQSLLDALYEIRRAVSGANYTAGIDSKLADIARLEKDIQFYTPLSKGKSRETDLVLNGKLDKIRNDKSENSRSRIYGYSDTVSTTVVSQEQIDQVKAEIQNLKKQKQKINDEVLELNIKTEIPLSEDVVKTLQDEGLI
jgi:uncharacterized protein YdcH (DUF465 family)